MKKQAQVWSLDITVALVIFLSAMIMFYVYTINLSQDTESKSDEMRTDLEFFSSNILSEGSPKGWNTTNVFIPGISSHYEINQTNLNFLYNLTYSGYPASYERVMSLLGTRFNFYFYFNDKMNITLPSGTEIQIDGIGKIGVNRTNITAAENPSNIVKIERFTVYQKKPTKLTLLFWSK